MAVGNCERLVVRPVGNALMVQNWRTVAFLHWKYDASALQRRLPRGLEVDTFDGSAWIGLVPFVINGLRIRSTPAIPWTSEFPETNVRTYVRGPGGEPGVWFFTLEAASLPAVGAARASFGLPYHWAKMRVAADHKHVEYTSRRFFSSAHTHIRICPGDPTPASDLEIFLTARFRLYAVRFGRLIYADIEHQPWPLHSARVLHLAESLLDACDLKTHGNPIAHYAPIVHTRVGAPNLAIM